VYDIVALGELLIDFSPIGKNDRGSFQFEANPGGAPCNVLAAARKLGHPVAFIGKVGQDIFGRYLKDTLDQLGINSDGLIMTPDYFTTLAFVTLDNEGNRDFSFSRKNSADVMLRAEEIQEQSIRKSRIFHCGTLSLTDSACREATFKALNIAKSAGVLISVDPNLREPLWPNIDDAKKAMESVLTYADIIKISDYELAFLYGSGEVLSNATKLMEQYNPQMLFVTCGKDGAYLIRGDLVLQHPCFNEVKTIDTTGAGDSFCGTALSCLLEYGLNPAKITEKQCRELLRYSSAAASLTTTKRGAITSMPSDSEIRALLEGTFTV
jgi:fructokinase